MPTTPKLTRTITRSKYLAFVVGRIIPHIWAPILFGSRSAYWSMSRENALLAYTFYYALYIFSALVCVYLIVKAGVDETNRRLSTESSEPPYDLRDTLLLRTKGLGKDLSTAAVSLILLKPVISVATRFSYWLFQGFPYREHMSLTAIKAFHGPFERGLVVFQAALLAPIIEEVMFRGVLFTALKERFGLRTGIVISGLMFACVHPNMPYVLIPHWIFGATLAYIAHRRQSLLPGMILHGTYNAILMMQQIHRFS